jgi:hypothetical protein
MKPLLTACMLLALAAPAIADDSELAVPEQCMPLVPEVRESPLFWDQWMALAACLQDGSVLAVSRVGDVEPMVDGLMLSITPPIMLYREALEQAPRTIKLRAAFHVGMLAVAMITRARLSITARDAKLSRELEPLLEPARDMARVAFVAVIEEAARHADLRADPVNRYMVVASQAHLQSLGDKKPIQTVRALH